MTCASRPGGRAHAALASLVSGCTSDVGLLPGSNQPGPQDEEHAIRFRACRPFHLAPEDEEWLSEEGICCSQFRLALAQVGQGGERQGGSERFRPTSQARGEGMQAAIFQLLQRGHNTRHRRRFSIMEEYRRWSRRMLSTTADWTPTLLCLQARKEIFLDLEGLVFERMIQVADTGTAKQFKELLCHHFPDELATWFRHLESLLMS